MQFKPNDTVFLKLEKQATASQIGLMAKLKPNTAYHVEAVVVIEHAKTKAASLMLTGHTNQYPAEWFLKDNSEREEDPIAALRAKIAAVYPNAINTLTAKAADIINFANSRIDAGVKKIEEFEKTRSRYEMLTEILARPQDLGTLHRGNDGAWMLMRPDWSYHGPYTSLQTLIDEQLAGVEPTSSYETDK